MQQTLERINVENLVLPRKSRFRTFEPYLDGGALGIIRCNNTIGFVLLLIQTREMTNNLGFFTVLVPSVCG